MSASRRLIKSLSRTSVLSVVERTTKRSDTKRRVITNNSLIGRIKRAAPSIVLKSDSAPAAITAWSKYVIKHDDNAPNTRRLLSLLNKLIPAIYGNSGAAAQQNMMKNIRKAIAKHQPSLVDASMNLMRYDQVAWRAARAAYKSSIVAANKSARPTTTTNEIDSVIARALQSSHYGDWVAAAELSSGARVGEILSRSVFAAVPRAHHIKQSHLSKKSARNKEQFVVKPIIGMDVAAFIDLIKKIRAALPDSAAHLTGYALSQRLNPIINRRVKSLMPGKTSHTLRKLYAARAFKEHGDGMSESGYISTVLGHAPDSLEVAASYTTHQIEGKGAAADIPRNTKQRDGLGIDRITATITAMKAAEMPLTYKSIRVFGYGTALIRQAKRAGLF